MQCFIGEGAFGQPAGCEEKKNLHSGIAKRERVTLFLLFMVHFPWTFMVLSNVLSQYIYRSYSIYQLSNVYLSSNEDIWDLQIDLDLKGDHSKNLQGTLSLPQFCYTAKNYV